MLIARSNCIRDVFLFSPGGKSNVLRNYVCVCVVVPLGCLLSKHADHRDIKSWTSPKHPPSGFFAFWSSLSHHPDLHFLPLSHFFPTDIQGFVSHEFLLVLLKSNEGGQKEVLSVCCWCLFRDSYASHLFLWVALGVFYTLTHFAEEKLDTEPCEGCDLLFWLKEGHFLFRLCAHVLLLCRCASSSLIEIRQRLWVQIDLLPTYYHMIFVAYVCFLIKFVVYTVLLITICIFYYFIWKSVQVLGQTNA